MKSQSEEVMTTLKLNPPLKWHGGKHYLAERIVALMPPHTHYVEPYAGGLAVLLARDGEGVSEVVNDLNGSLVNFWRVLRDEEPFARFARIVQATPFSRREWEDAGDRLDSPDCVARAAAFFVRCRQSRSGLMDTFAPLSRTRTRRGMNEQASAWMTAVDGLSEVHARLRRVVIENAPALEVIRREDGPETLFYCDPPYLHSTRTAAEAYTHEMSEDEHRHLLEALRDCKGKVMLSGYRSDLYDALLSDWYRQDFDLPNNAAGGKSKRRMVECVWCNWHVTAVVSSRGADRQRFFDDLP
jgi:DNA adenine methylase